MGRYLVLWETDMSRIPEDPKEQFALFSRIIDMLKEDIKNGLTKDFGMFFGGNEGYTIDEGTEEEVTIGSMKYSPYIKCKVCPIISIEQLDNIMKKFANM